MNEIFCNYLTNTSIKSIKQDKMKKIELSLDCESLHGQL
jgi:hypothetical protein